MNIETLIPDEAVGQSEPDTLVTAFHQALALHRGGDLDAAQDGYLQILARQPRHGDALNLMGALAGQRGEHARSAELISQAIAVDSEKADYHYNLGIALKGLGQLTAAVASYERAIGLQPAYVNAYENCGLVLYELGQSEAALQRFDQALVLNPQDPSIHSNRGNAFGGLQQYEAALRCYEQALALDPDYVAAHISQGNALKMLGHYDAAIASYERALAIAPNDVDAHFMLGSAYHETQQWDQALASYDRALTLQPRLAQAHYNRGVVLNMLQLFHAALGSYQRAIDCGLLQGRASLEYNKSLIFLLMGEFAEGWDLYESRWNVPALEMESKHSSYPAWRGETSLAGKTVLVHSEQGLGDILQFCRYVTAVAAMGARVVFEVPHSLLGVMQSLQGVSHLMAWGLDSADLGETIDLQCPLLSLPLAFRTDFQTIPAGPRYLHSQPEKLLAWRERLGPAQRPRVGLVWSGSPTHQFDRQRSIPLEQLKIYLPKGVDYVCLQKEVRASDQTALDASADIQSFSSELNDFDDTAALVECMDWVISVDTSVAHLAGALGKPLWLLLPFVPDWRWMLERDTSPWYPSATLYRQPTPNDWNSVLIRLRRDIEAHVKGWDVAAVEHV